MDVFQHESVCMGLARGRWGRVLVRPCRSGGLSRKGRTRTGIAGAIIRGLTRDTTIGYIS